MYMLHRNNGAHPVSREHPAQHPAQRIRSEQPSNSLNLSQRSENANRVSELEAEIDRLKVFCNSAPEEEKRELLVDCNLRLQVENEQLLRQRDLQNERIAELEGKVENLSEVLGTLKLEKRELGDEIAALLDDRATREAALEKIYRKFTHTLTDLKSKDASEERLVEMHDLLSEKVSKVQQELKRSEELIFDITEMTLFMKEQLGMWLPALCERSGVASPEQGTVNKDCPAVMETVLFLYRSLELLKGLQSSFRDTSNPVQDGKLRSEKKRLDKEVLEQADEIQSLKERYTHVFSACKHKTYAHCLK
eukprot:sb/3467195/